jgi:hypothetical protein
VITDRISELEAAAHDTLRRDPLIENHPLFISVSGRLEFIVLTVCWSGFGV